jgi:hypothetical protein
MQSRRIRAEVRENLWWLQVRADYEPCINAMLGKLDGVLAQARNGQRTPPLTEVGLPVHSKITSLRWDANAQAGRASLFSGDEQRNLGNMYFTTEEFRSSQEAEETVWAKLGFLNGLDHFTSLDVHEFSVLLAQARYLNFRAELDIERGRQWSSKLNLTAANPTPVEIIHQHMVSKKSECPKVFEGAA